MTNEESVFIHESKADNCLMIHDANGKLVGVRRIPRPRGAKIVNMTKFRAAWERSEPPAEPWVAFVSGILLGATLMAILCMALRWFA